MSIPIIEKIKTADNLPSLPTVAIQVIQMTQTEDVSVADIARVIQQDPALTVKVLKVVNSSLFGMSRKISSVQQAMVVLGLRTVKVMVLSFSLVDTMQRRRAGNFDFTGYWRRSLTTAVTAKLLAERLSKSVAEEAFVSGLLCDIGMLAAFHCAGELYLPVLEAYERKEGTIQEIEQRVLGTTHEAITAALLGHWGLPEALCRPVATHHAPVGRPSADGQPPEPLVRVLRAAATLADLFCTDTQAGHLDACRHTLIEELPLAEAALNGVLDAVDSHVKETASLFALKIGPTKSYQEIQAEAVVQLARLSMAAEIERAQTAQREQAARQEVEQLNTRNRELVEKAATDALTGIGNRSAFEDRLKAACSSTAGGRQAMGLLLMDLDRFKKLNDTFGHQVGDEALRQVGGVLRKLGSDTRVPCRYGGEEFALIVTDCTAQSLRELAEELRMSVQQLAIRFGHKQISITVSIGATFAEPGEPDLEPKTIIKRADECLYDAKYAGRNRVVFSPLTGPRPRLPQPVHA
ncbi:MAG: GGDEF domain-containing protein [Phycisphaerae bacterium]